MPLNQPPINELLEKADSCYTLVVESAKRARAIIAGSQPLLDPKDHKPVSIAVDEIHKGYLRYHRNLEDEEE